MKIEQKAQYDKVNLSVYKPAFLLTKKNRQGAVVSLDAVVNRIHSGDKGLVSREPLLSCYLSI